MANQRQRNIAKAKLITVAIKDIHKVCHICGQVKEDVHPRSYLTKDFEGSCGDSFCFASCSLVVCRGREGVYACGDCEKEGR